MGLLRLMAEVGQDAAVGVEDLAVDEVGGVGGQEYAGPDHVLRLAPAAGGRLGDDKGVEGAAAAVGPALAQGRGLRGGNVAGAHAVALDVVLAELGGDVLGQHLQAALGRRVARDGLAAQLAHHRADVDDLACPLVDHGGQHRLGAVEGAHHVDLQHLFKVLGAGLQHGLALDDAGVVDQDVHRAHLGGDLIHHRLDGVPVGHVGDVAVRVDAGRLVGRHALFVARLGRAVETDFRAAVRHPFRNGKTNAVGAAGDQRDLAAQVKCREFHGVSSFLSVVSFDVY